MSKGKAGAAILFAALLVAIVAAGCGGGGSSTTGSEEAAPSKARFIAEADAICKANDTKLNKEVEDFAEEEGFSSKNEPSKDQEAELVDNFLVPNLSTESDELGELTPPEGDEATVEKLLGNLEKGVEEAESDPTTILEAGSDSPFQAASKEAKAYGLKVCGGNE